MSGENADSGKIVNHRKGLGRGVWEHIALNPNPSYEFREDYGHPHDPDVQPSRPDVTVCLRCHDEANSPEFDYPSYLPRGSCVETTSSPLGTGIAQPNGAAQDER